MNIFGMQKLTLLDYPGKTAATIFTNGCDFRCPFCHNAMLLDNSGKSLLSEEEVFSFLKSRQGILDGICISGGEPLIQSGIEDFIREIKKMGFDVMLDTNAQNSKVLKKLMDNNLLDYIAMDIKNSLENYPKSVGIYDLDTKHIERSIKYILTGKVPYEFRTTVVRQYHKIDDFHRIGQKLRGAEKYYLQAFRDSENVLKKGLSASSNEDMKIYCDILKAYNINAYIR